MQKIQQGLTNHSYIKDGKFFQDKVYTGFNHTIDYSILKTLDFVPKLYENNNEFISWELIGGDNPTTSDENIISIAKLIHKTHNSKLKFPSFNIKKRIVEYLKILNKKGIKIPKIDEYYQRINKILANMKKDTPSHNDLWLKNLVKKEDKIYITDWEYATMNDKHFDLAYFIESCNLTDEQETVFLDAYDDYVYEYILQQKILVNYLVVLWVNCQPKKYFDDQEYIDRLDKYSQQILDRRKS